MLPVAADHATVNDPLPGLTVTAGTTPTCASGVAVTCSEALTPNEFTLSTVKACATPPISPVTTHVVSVVAHTTVPAEFRTRYDVVFVVAAHTSLTDSNPAVLLDTDGIAGIDAVVDVSTAELSEVPATFEVVAVSE